MNELSKLFKKYMSIGDYDLVILKDKINEELNDELKKRGLTALKQYELRYSKICPKCSKRIKQKSTMCGSCASKCRDNSKMKYNFKIMKNEKHPMWKGDNVGYDALHRWIRINKPLPNCCETCKRDKKLEAANLSGEYKRDINDFKWLCRSCHKKFDWKEMKRNKHVNFIKQNGN